MYGGLEDYEGKTVEVGLSNTFLLQPYSRVRPQPQPTSDPVKLPYNDGLSVNLSIVLPDSKVRAGVAYADWDVDIDFDITNWWTSNASPAYPSPQLAGWEWVNLGFGTFPRYALGATSATPLEYMLEAVWPFGCVLGWKYKLMGYPTEQYKGIKYLYAQVGPGNIDCRNCQGSATGSAATDQDRMQLSRYFTNISGDCDVSNYYDAGHVIGDRQGGVAKYWNLFPQLWYVNQGRDLVDYWTQFEQWIYNEVTSCVAAGQVNCAVHVFVKFIYCDMQATYPRSGTPVTCISTLR